MMEQVVDSTVVDVIKNKRDDDLWTIFEKRGLAPKQDDLADHKAFSKYLKSIDLTVLFGVAKSFCCIFHPDQHPSARVFQAESGDWLYYCNSENCRVGGQGMNLVQITAQLQGATNTEAFRFLCEVCKYRRDKNSKYTVSIFDDNISEIENCHFQKSCPKAAKIVKMPFLKALYEFGQSGLWKCREECCMGDSALFSISNRQFRKCIGKENYNKVSNFLAMLAYLQIIRRVPLYELSEKRYCAVMTYLRAHKGYLPTNQVEIYRLTEERLRRIESAAIKWNERQYMLSNFTYQAVYREEGSFAAHTLFPSGGQAAGCKDGNSQITSSGDFFKALSDGAEEEISTAGAATLSELRNYLQAQGFSKSQISSSLKAEIDVLCRQGGYRRTREGHRVIIVRDDNLQQVS
jgi:hypothetical protein